MISKKYRVLAIVGILLLVGSTFAATKDDVSKPNLPRAAEGEAYDSSTIFPLPEEISAVQLPVPENKPTLTALQGPVAAADSKLSMSMGNAIVGPRGGAVLSAQQRADRQIRKVIRGLH